MITIFLAQAATTVPANPSFPNQTGIGGIIPRILPECAETGCTRLEDVMTLFTNISQVVLGATGMVLLGVLVYAGILYLTSAGEQSKVKKATDMLKACVLGLAIVFGAFTVISYGVAQLVGAPQVPTSSYEICNGNNNNAPCGPNSVCLDGVCELYNDNQ